MTMSEVAVFLKEEGLSLFVSYSGESADIVNKRTWAAILRLTGRCTAFVSPEYQYQLEVIDGDMAGVVSVSAPADTMEAAVERVIEMWRER